jgi:RsiW-degrading membrane proteinase PrsW (M82 family)
MHAAYALVVGAALLLQGRHRLIRVAGLAYPLFVVFIVVATGNHFLFDVGAGAFVDVLAATAARLLLRGSDCADHGIRGFDQLAAAAKIPS